MFVRVSFVAGLALALSLAGCGKPGAGDGRVFGIARGEQLSALPDARMLNEPPMLNYAFTPREKDPAFTDYAVLAAPTVGVCRVRAKGTGMTQNGLDALRDRLRRQYGEAGFSAQTGSYFWPQNFGEALGDSHIGTIVLSYFGSDVSLTYTFDNIAACDHEIAVQTGPGD